MDDHLTLSPRQTEIATLVATGASNKEIARQLAISEKTVKNILTQVFVKTCTQSRTELAVHWVISHNYMRTPLVQGALLL
jgi:DNA-binding NarL/FixJ family response regulator